MTAVALDPKLHNFYVHGMDGLAIRELLHQQPFQPFILHLAGGRAFEVPHTDFISISRNGRRVIVEKDDNSFEIIDVLLVNSVEVKPSAKAA